MSSQIVAEPPAATAMGATMVMKGDELGCRLSVERDIQAGPMEVFELLPDWVFARIAICAWVECGTSRSGRPG